MYDKKAKKGKKLPKIYDDSRVTPKVQRMQYSTDFGKGKYKRNAYGGAIHQGGYETENVISPDNHRNDIFKFGSTADSGFEMSDAHGIHEGMISTGGPVKPKKKKYTYMTLKNDHKSRSVSSNLGGRMDHTCFI